MDIESDQTIQDKLEMRREYYRQYRERRRAKSSEVKHINADKTLIGLAYRAAAMGMAYDPFYDHTATLVKYMMNGDAVVNIGIRQSEGGHQNVKVIVPMSIEFTIYEEDDEPGVDPTDT